SVAFCAWLSIFGLLGLCLRCFTWERSGLRYLADASYWLYLCHLPLVALLQLDLYELPLAPELKFLIVVGLTVALGLASYHTLVRYTIVGAWLHGTRTRALTGPFGTASNRATSTGAPAKKFHKQGTLATSRLSGWPGCAQ